MNRVQNPVKINESCGKMTRREKKKNHMYESHVEIDKSMKERKKRCEINVKKKRLEHTTIMCTNHTGKKFESLKKK